MAGMTHIKNHFEGVSSKRADGRGALVRLWCARWWRALLCALPGLAEPPVSWAVELIEAVLGARVDLARQWCDEQLEKAGSFTLAAMRATLGHARELSAHARVYVPRAVPRCLREWLPTTIWASPEEVEHAPDFNLIATAFQPVLFNIAAFACGSPEELATLTTQTSKSVAAELEHARNSCWSNLYKQRWPAFHEFLNYQGLQRWNELYEDTLAGKTEVVLEIFDREKKLGFAMAAMGARVTFEPSSRSYVARYISAVEGHPEHIPQWEEHRLRCCPPAVRDALRLGPLPDGLYLHRVLEGFEGLRPGVGIELQWKMQQGSPFGWWFGRLEALERDTNGVLATATVTFVHFPIQSRWRTLQVRFGDSQMRPCSFGGFTGGIRRTTEAEQKHWMRFFPRKAAVL